MELEFPYQLVAFLDRESALGEPVYYGEKGWYPQIALKRRFKIEGIDELGLIKKLNEFCEGHYSFSIQTKGVVQPERMPVRALEVETTPELIDFHTEFIDFMGENMVSRFPERDGDNYFPHITLEYDGKVVVDDSLYDDKQILIEKVFLLKDEADQNSTTYREFNLKRNRPRNLRSLY
jgi:hypothetical protein